MSGYRAESCAIKNLDEIRQEWESLQQRADCSFFQSWGWIGTWLELLVNDLEPVLIKIWFEDEIVGMGVFVPRQISRRGVFHSSAMFLHEYPFDSRNMVIEYNGYLADKEHEQAVCTETNNYLLKTFHDTAEFFFGGVSEHEKAKLSQAIGDAEQVNIKVLEQSLTFSVELDAFDPDVNAFLGTLSKNRRAQIRRSIQLYEDNSGALEIIEAQTVEEALIFFDGLKAFHTERWQNKGEAGSFSNTRWEAFHLALIQDRFDEGEIQLLKIVSHSTEIGYLYNFVWRKHVYVLQTGFETPSDKRLMPGYVAHVMAIVHNNSQGMSVYDLMHGDSLYKRMLCDHSQTLYWLVLQRHRLKFVVEELAVSIVRGLKHLTKKKD